MRKAKDIGSYSILELTFKLAADLPEKGIIRIKTTQADYTTVKADHACNAFIRDTPLLLHCYIDLEGTSLVIKLSAAFEKVIPNSKEIVVKFPIRTTQDSSMKFNLKYLPIHYFILFFSDYLQLEGLQPLRIRGR